LKVSRGLSPRWSLDMKTPLLLAALLLVPATTLLAYDAGHESKRGRHHGGGIERLDTDHDGRISRAEFDAGRAAREARIAQHPERRRDGAARRTPPDFATLDTNRDGYIVRTEVRAYHERIRPQRETERKARLVQRFNAADLNRDGKLGRMEVSEKLPRIQTRFDWMDDNRDGFLSLAEMQWDDWTR
jgi:hypothetical protein